MRGDALHHPSGVRPVRPLVVRGGLVRTFGGLVGFLAITFLCWGTYLLVDAFANPIEAQAAALICGAFIIALATILLYYLVKPTKTSGAAASSRARHVISLAESGAQDEPLAVDRHPDSRADLAYQRGYVDHTRIRP